MNPAKRAAAPMIMIRRPDHLSNSTDVGSSHTTDVMSNSELATAITANGSPACRNAIT